MTTVSKTAFRDAMAKVTAPVSIITTNGVSGRGGFTATSICSVTDEPPTLLVCMNVSSSQAQRFVENGQFVVNVLAHDQQKIAELFAGRTKDMDERFAAGSWSSFEGGLPALDHSIVSFACATSDVRRVGTHNIMLGEVKDIMWHGAEHGLLYFDRAYVRQMAGLDSFGG